MLEIRDVAAQPTAVNRAVTPADELGSVIDRTFPALFGRLGEHGVAPAGPPFVRYLDTGDDRLEVELGVPVPGDATAFDGADTSTIPGRRVDGGRNVRPHL